MKLLSRFTKVQAMVLLITLFTNACVTQSGSGDESRIIFPRPFAFAIDDLGWNVGTDEGDLNNQGPYRIGIDRKMDLDDYKCIVEVARKSGVRMQGLFILSEMDRENILCKYPTITWMGENWDNTKNVSSEQIEIMNFVKENAAYLEFGLHGVGHEYWVDGVKKRAEWYCTDNNHPWPEETLRDHIQCFKDIMGQYGLSEENGQSFPESFVPCAYSFYWNPEGDYSTGTILGDAGVKYANTLFDYIPELSPPKGANGGGFDHGVLVVNRKNYGNDWYKLDALPTIDLHEQESDIIESHWSNWLAQDNFLQESVNEKWIAYYKMVQSSKDRYLAKNTEQFSSQWLYKKYTSVKETTPGVVEIDNTKMTSEAYEHGLLGNMVLKVKLDSGQHVRMATINDEPVGCYFEEAGYGFIYLPRLEQQTYEFTYKLGEKTPESYIFNKGTYNVYSYSTDKDGSYASLRIYGEQTVDFFGLEEVGEIVLSSDDVSVVSKTYDPETQHLALSLQGVDMQGETFDIQLTNK
jgi:hypothetical protein